MVGVCVSKLASSFARRPPRHHSKDIMIKPDGVQRALIADIISRFEKRGYKLVGLKIRQPSKELLEVRGPRADDTRDGVKHAHALADLLSFLLTTLDPSEALR